MTSKPPSKRAPSAKPRKGNASASPRDTAELAQTYSRKDEEREEDEALGQEPAVADRSSDEDGDMAGGTLQDQLVYQGLEENRTVSGDLARAEKARDALSERTASSSNPGRRTAKPAKAPKTPKASRSGLKGKATKRR